MFLRVFPIVRLSSLWWRWGRGGGPQRPPPGPSAPTPATRPAPARDPDPGEAAPPGPCGSRAGRGAGGLGPPPPPRLPGPPRPRASFSDPIPHAPQRAPMHEGRRFLDSGSKVPPRSSVSFGGFQQIAFSAEKCVAGPAESKRSGRQKALLRSARCQGPKDRPAALKRTTVTIAREA